MWASTSSEASSSSSAARGNRGSRARATWWSWAMAEGWSGWAKMVRTNAATGPAADRGTVASRLRMKWTRTLPGRPRQDLGDGPLQPLVGLGDHEDHAPEPPAHQGAQEGRPKHMVLGRLHVHPEDWRHPSVVTPTATTVAMDTARPASRTLW
jgi:hypothetical protein